MNEALTGKGGNLSARLSDSDEKAFQTLLEHHGLDRSGMARHLIHQAAAQLERCALNPTQGIFTPIMPNGEQSIHWEVRSVRNR